MVFPRLQKICQCKRKLENLKKKLLPMTHSLWKRSPSFHASAKKLESKVSKNLFS